MQMSVEEARPPSSVQKLNYGKRGLVGVIVLIYVTRDYFVGTLKTKWLSR